MLFLFYAAMWIFTTGRFIFSLFSCVLVSFVSIVVTSLWEERESWFMCFSCICLFILHALMFVLFVFFLM